METSYRLSKKQLFFQKNVANFVKRHIKPHEEVLDREAEFPEKILAALAANRFPALLVPREDGGEGAGYLDLCVAVETVAATCPATALMLSVQNLGARLTALHGNADQKERYLSRIMTGEGVFGYTLPDWTDLKLTRRPPLEATREGDGFRINGQGVSMVNADTAGIVCLFTGEGDRVLVFLADREKLTLTGTRQEGARGGEARGVGLADLAGALPAESDLLGSPADGTDVMAGFMADAALLTAARALGLSRGAMDYARQYAGQREQFGRPVGKFQAVGYMLAEMDVRIQAARQLVYKAAALMDQGDRDGRRFCSMARYFAAKTAAAVTADAVQVGGGYAYTRDYPLEKMMRNANLCLVMDGGNDAHLMTILG